METGLEQISDSHNSVVTQAAKLETNPDPFSTPSLFVESHTWKLQFHDFAMSLKLRRWNQKILWEELFISKCIAKQLADDADENSFSYENVGKKPHLLKFYTGLDEEAIEFVLNILGNAVCSGGKKNASCLQKMSCFNIL